VTHLVQPALNALSRWLNAFSLFVLASWCSSIAFGESFSRSVPKFGTPIVFSNALVFSAPVEGATLIIGIDRQSGSKLWQMSVTNAGASVLTGLSEPILFSGGRLSTVSLNTGAITFRVDTEVTNAIVKSAVISSNRLLLHLEWGTDQLLMFDGAWSKRWHLQKVYRLLNHTATYALVEFADREEVSGYSFGFTTNTLSLPKNRRIGLVDIESGVVKWSLPVNESRNGVILGEYVVLAGSGRIASLRVSDGSVDSRIEVATDNSQAPIWTMQGSVYRGVSSNLLVQVSVPRLEQKVIAKLKEPPWLLFYGGQTQVDSVFISHAFQRPVAYDLTTAQRLWPATLPTLRLGYSDHFADWAGVHDGFIYTSEARTVSARMFIKEIEVKTGKERELFSMPMANNR